MSAITGICDLPAIAGSASASSWLGHGDPHDVAAGCRELGDLLERRVDVGRGGRASSTAPRPGRRRPTSTLPTLIFRLARRGATTGGGSGGIPRETDMEPSVRARARSAMIDAVQTRDDLDRALADDAEATRLRPQLGGLRHEADSARVDLEAMRERATGRGRGRRAARGVRPDRGARPPCGARGRGRSTASGPRRSPPGTHCRPRRPGSRPSRAGARTSSAAWRSSATPRPGGRPAGQAHATALRASGGPAAGSRPCSTSWLPCRRRCAELAEAQEAGIRAVTALTLARNELGSADSWSAYDTWFGGGLISSSIKHDRIDDAGGPIAPAQEALVDLARELGDVQDVSRAASRPRHLPHDPRPSTCGSTTSSATCRCARASRTAVAGRQGRRRRARGQPPDGAARRGASSSSTRGACGRAATRCDRLRRAQPPRLIGLTTSA